MDSLDLLRFPFQTLTYMNHRKQTIYSAYAFRDSITAPDSPSQNRITTPTTESM
jgi:hypothetical protein